MQTPQKKFKEIQRMFSAFPPLNTVDADETLRRYFEVVEDFHADLVEEAVTLYVTGAMPGFDGRFCPTPPMLASGCRKAAENAARRRYLENLTLPRLPSPTIEHAPESKARVKEMAQHAAETIGSVNLHHEREAIAYAKERWEKTNARFQPDMSDEGIAERLLKRRPFDVGAPESDEAAA